MFSSNFYGLRGQALQVAIGVIAGMDFLLFGVSRKPDNYRPLSC